MLDFNPRRILVIDLLYLGDLLFATPFFKNLRANYPQARIDLIANANFASILADSDYFDQIYSYDKSWSIKESLSFALAKRKNNYDLGINLHGNWRTAILLRVINPEYNLGFGGRGRGIWLDKELDALSEQDGHMVDVYLSVLAELGINNYQASEPKLNLNPAVKEQAVKILETEGIDISKELIALNTGGSWPTKRWGKEKFAQLADRLIAEKKAQVIFTGGPSDEARIEEIIAQMKNPATNLAGKTSLAELKAVASLCDLFVSGDTGPVHVANAVGTKVVAIFGPSDESKYRPRGEQAEIILNDKLECRPCGEHQCPLEHHKCMADILVEAVIKRSV